MTFIPESVRTGSVALMASYPPGATFGPRVTSNFQFIWLLGGSAHWIVENATAADGSPRTERHLLTPGMLALARPGMTDTLLWDESETSVHAFVHFEIEGPPTASMLHGPLVRSMVGNPPLAGLCEYLLSLAGMDEENARARSDQVIAALFDIFTNGPLPAESQSALPQRLLAAVDHVRTIWDAEGLCIIALEELAGACGMSAGHFSRLFSKELGCGPVTALEQIRLARAAILLVRSSVALPEIALLCGFGDSYHFSHRFTKAYGTPPGKYRREARRTDAFWPLTRPELLPLWRALGLAGG